MAHCDNGPTTADTSEDVPDQARATASQLAPRQRTTIAVTRPRSRKEAAGPARVQGRIFLAVEKERVVTVIANAVLESLVNPTAGECGVATSTEMSRDLLQLAALLVGRMAEEYFVYFGDATSALFRLFLFAFPRSGILWA